MVNSCCDAIAAGTSVVLLLASCSWPTFIIMYLWNNLHCLVTHACMETIDSIPGTSEGWPYKDGFFVSPDRICIAARQFDVQSLGVGHDILCDHSWVQWWKETLRAPRRTTVHLLLFVDSIHLILLSLPSSRPRARRDPQRLHRPSCCSTILSCIVTLASYAVYPPILGQLTSSKHAASFGELRKEAADTVTSVRQGRQKDISTGMAIMNS